MHPTLSIVLAAEERRQDLLAAARADRRASNAITPARAARSQPPERVLPHRAMPLLATAISRLAGARNHHLRPGAA